MGTTRAIRDYRGLLTSQSGDRDQVIQSNLNCNFFKRLSPNYARPVVA